MSRHNHHPAIRRACPGPQRAAGARALLGVLLMQSAIAQTAGADPPSRMINPDDFRHYVEDFNQADVEDIVNFIPNAQSWEWLKENVPFFACPDPMLEQNYYYRWWTFRKHIKKTSDSFVLTEFITPVGHAGKYNTISCALGHHVMEGRWLADRQFLKQYITFWFRGNDGGPQPHFHKFSSWIAAALDQYCRVTSDREFVLGLLPDLVRDFEVWETERMLPDGKFWQYGVRDGMEESISGGRRVKNVRPTINSYMCANARAIARFAALAGDAELEKKFTQKAEQLRSVVREYLWDAQAHFFKVRLENGEFSDAREELGFIPWYFNIPLSEHAAAWAQALDPRGFKAPKGFMTAERRHPQFRSHGAGSCEWDGAVWPFASAQTLTAMANFLRTGEQSVLSKEDYFDALKTYAASHQKNGKPYLGEYHDEITGAWLKGDNPRSRYYNHSTFCDLVIAGLVGLIPRDDDVVEIHPLLPAGRWEWFALDNISYRGKKLAIVWDETGEKFGRGKGLSVYVDGRLAARADALQRIEGKLSEK